MARSSADIEQCESMGALSQAGAGARALGWRSLLGMAAACLVAAALLLALPGSAGKATSTFRAVNVISAQDEGGTYDKLLSMIKENNETLPGMIQEVTNLVKNGDFAEVAKKAIEIQKLLDQNERNMQLHELVVKTKEAMLEGNYTESQEQLDIVIQDKCNALTRTQIAGLKIELKQGLDQEDWEGITALVAQLEPLQKRCDEKDASLAVIKNASQASVA